MRGAVWGLLFATTVVAEEPRATPTPPIDRQILFEVSLVGKRREFHMGEIIPIKISFSSRIKDRYQVNEANYDRSGRMNYEHFVATPADGVVDPLSSYFATGVHIGGGLTNVSFLTKEPAGLQLNLNEWLRFIKPGDYRLTVTSERVEAVDPSSSSALSPVTAKSNEIAFKILPRDEAWEKKTYDRAVATLQKALPADLENDRSLASYALEILRFLGTADAARELVKQLGKSAANSDCYFGLIASPEPTVAREALEAALEDPDYSLGDDVLGLLSWFGRSETRKDEDSPQEERAFLEKLERALSKKRGPALPISLYNVLNRALFLSQPALPREELEKLVTQLVPIFDQLPIKDQEELLEYKWDEIKSPAFLPLLKKYVQEEKSDFSNAQQEDSANVQRLVALALRHWYELDPVSARPAVISEVVRPSPRFNSSEIGFLPDMTLPEADKPLAEHLAAEKLDEASNVTALIWRYATSAIVPDVIKQLDPHIGKAPCDCQNALLAFLLRVDPSLARPRIERAILARGKQFNACNQMLLTDISGQNYYPVLEEIAVNTLDDPDPLVVADAATMLGQFGSAAAESKLLRRYESWTKRWNPHAAELNFAGLKDVVGGKADQLRLGHALFDALATGHSWLTDQVKLRHLAEITKAPIRSYRFDQYFKVWSEKHLVLSIDSCGQNSLRRFEARLGQYELNSIDRLKEKLLQFPKGTEFTLSLPFDKAHQECVDDVRQFLTNHGLSVIEEQIE